MKYHIARNSTGERKKFEIICGLGKRSIEKTVSFLEEYLRKSWPHSNSCNVYGWNIILGNKVRSEENFFLTTTPYKKNIIYTGSIVRFSEESNIEDFLISIAKELGKFLEQKSIYVYSDHKGWALSLQGVANNLFNYDF